MAVNERVTRTLLYVTLPLLFLAFVFLVAALADPNWLNTKQDDFFQTVTITLGAWQQCANSDCDTLTCSDTGSGECGEFNGFRAMLVLSMVLSLAMLILHGCMLGCMALADMLTAVRVMLSLLVVNTIFVMTTFSLLADLNKSYLDYSYGPAFGLDVTAFVLYLIAIGLLSVVIATWPFDSTSASTTTGSTMHSHNSIPTGVMRSNLPPGPTSSASYAQSQPSWQPYPQQPNPPPPAYDSAPQANYPSMAPPLQSHPAAYPPLSPHAQQFPGGPAAGPHFSSPHPQQRMQHSPQHAYNGQQY